MKPPRVKKSTHEIGRRVIECGHACLYDLDFILDSIQRHAKIETGPASQVLSDALSMIQQTDQRARSPTWMYALTISSIADATAASKENPPGRSGGSVVSSTS
jgi:hypothetical protein